MTKDELERTNQELQDRLNKLEKQGQAVRQPLVLPDPSITPMIPYEETEYVKVKLFRDEYRYKQPLYVAINGRNWLIKRGVEVTLPKYVADFIEQQMREESAIWERVAKEEQEYKDQTARLA